MIEVLPQQWVPVHLVQSYELVGSRLVVTPVPGKKTRPIIEHEFGDSRQAADWVRGLDLLTRAHKLLRSDV